MRHFTIKLKSKLFLFSGLVLALALAFLPRSANRLAADFSTLIAANSSFNAGCQVVEPGSPFWQQFCTGSSQSASSFSQSQSSGVQNSAVSAQSQVMAMDNFFSPQNITVAPGTTVMWRNAGMMPHTVTADNGMFDSGTLAPGATYSFTFTSPGTFRYYCRFHGGPNGVGMSGIITVTGSSVSPGTSFSPVYQNPQPTFNYSMPIVPAPLPRRLVRRHRQPAVYNPPNNSGIFICPTLPSSGTVNPY